MFVIKLGTFLLKVVKGNKLDTIIPDWLNPLGLQTAEPHRPINFIFIFRIIDDVRHRLPPEIVLVKTIWIDQLRVFLLFRLVAIEESWKFRVRLHVLLSVLFRMVKLSCLLHCGLCLEMRPAYMGHLQVIGNRQDTENINTCQD